MHFGFRVDQIYKAVLADLQSRLQKNALRIPTLILYQGFMSHRISVLSHDDIAIDLGTQLNI